MVRTISSAGYHVGQPRHAVSDSPAGIPYTPDQIVEAGEDRLLLLSFATQSDSGTAEKKIPYEVMCLANALKSNGSRYAGAILVLGGDGWTLREFFTDGRLMMWLRGCDGVRVMSEDSFMDALGKHEI